MGLLDALLGAAIVAITSSKKSPSEMSDRELQRKLDKGVGKNTGESVSTRAHYIMEGKKRGIDANQKKK